MSTEGPVGGIPKHPSSFGVGDKPVGAASSDEGRFKGRRIRGAKGKRHTPPESGNQPRKKLHERTGSHKPVDVNYFADPQPDSLLSNTNDDPGYFSDDEPGTPPPESSDEDLMRQLEEVEARRKGAASNQSEDDGFFDDEDIGVEGEVLPKPKHSEPPNAKLELTGNPSEEAKKVKSTSPADDPEKARKQEKMEKHLKGKMSFLDKHKKSIIATAVGGVLIALAAGAAAVPGGIGPGVCIYAVGIMLVTQGVAHMLNDGANGTPSEDDKKEDNKPKTEDESKKKEDAKEKGKGKNGQYMIVDNPAYKGLNRQMQVDYSGERETAEVVDPGQIGKDLPKLAANPNPTATEVSSQATDILTGLQDLYGASAELKPSSVLEKILAKLAVEAGINPDDAEAVKRVTDAIDEFRDVVESGATPEEQTKALIDIVSKLIRATKPSAEASALLLNMLDNFELEISKGDPALVSSAREVSKQLRELLLAANKTETVPSVSGTTVDTVSDDHSKAATGAGGLQPGSVGQVSASAAPAVTPATLDELQTSTGRGRYLAFELELEKEVSSLERWEREEAKETLMKCAAAVLRSEEELRKDSKNVVPPFFAALLSEVNGLNKKTSAGIEYGDLVKNVQLNARTNNFLR